MAEKKKPAPTILRELFRDALARARYPVTVLSRLHRALPREGLSPKTYGDSAWMYSVLLDEAMPSSVRADLVDSIGVLGHHARGMAEKLLVSLESDDPELVEKTTVALSKIKCTTPLVLSALETLARDESRGGHLRSYAAWALSDLTGDPEYAELRRSIPGGAGNRWLGLSPVDDPIYDQTSIVVGGLRGRLKPKAVDKEKPRVDDSTNDASEETSDDE